MLRCTNHESRMKRPLEMESAMSKNTNHTQKTTTIPTIPGVEKLISEQTTRFEAAVAELGKLQSKSVAQVNVFVEGATRLAHEQIAFAEQMGGEYRKLMLAATRSAADYFAPKA
jgi:hypothetical protein